MKRILTTAAFVLSAATAPVAAADMSPEVQALYEKAKEEGELTWYVAQFSTGLAEDMGAIFTEKYPGVKVNVIRATGQVVYARLAQDIRAGVAQADVFSGSDLGHLYELKKQGQLLEFTPPDADGVRAPFKDMQPGFWYATTANPSVMAYNTDQVSAEDAPTNWDDLTDPKWKGKLAITHPGFSGSAGSWAVLMKKLYGDEFFIGLRDNDPYIGRSMIDPPTVIAAGERAVGIAVFSVAVRNKLAGNPIEIVYPTDGAKLTFGGTAVLSSAPHPNAGQLFVNFLLGPEASQRQVENGLLPVSKDVAPPEGVRSLEEIPIADLSEEEVIEGVQPIIEEWRDIFGG
ncbi:ABC transporter substrate-binding protein [Pseudooceanicola pacificus]|nr:extracellular solute-binding protein [Pseudooceanicola pacificus]